MTQISSEKVSKNLELVVGGWWHLQILFFLIKEVNTKVRNIWIRYCVPFTLIQNIYIIVMGDPSYENNYGLG